MFKISYAVLWVWSFHVRANTSPRLSRAMSQTRANLESSPNMLFFIIFEFHGYRKAVLKRSHSETFPDKYNTLRLSYSYIWLLGCKMLQVSSHSKSIFKVWCWDGTYGWNSWGKLMDMRYRITVKPHFKYGHWRRDRKCPSVLARGVRIRLDHEGSCFFPHSHVLRAKR